VRRPRYEAGAEQTFKPVLTRDNPHLSRLKNGSPEDPDGSSNVDQPAPIEDQSQQVSNLSRASNCTIHTDPVSDEVAALVEASIADNTRRAYRSDLDHFAAWGGTLPAEPALVASYLPRIR